MEMWGGKEGSAVLQHFEHHDPMALDNLSNVQWNGSSPDLHLSKRFETCVTAVRRVVWSQGTVSFHSQQLFVRLSSFRCASKSWKVVILRGCHGATSNRHLKFSPASCGQQQQMTTPKAFTFTIIMIIIIIKVCVHRTRPTRSKCILLHRKAFLF